MKILTRYVIRAHVGPFVFAFTAVTGLLFLNAVAQRMEDLAGRGLEFSVIAEFMLLSLPHIVALTFPMAILVAVLYAFSDMTSQNEVAAIAGGGIHPVRLMVPPILVGFVLSGMMFIFNDRILPESNHRLSGMLADLASRSPTFQLREEVVNEIHTGDNTQYFLRARTIDQSTNHMEGVTIFDLSTSGTTRTIVAEEGTMAFTSDMNDLVLTLENGVVYEASRDRPGTFQTLDYRTQILPLRGVGQAIERQEVDSRSDREMNIQMLQGRVDQNVSEIQRLADESHQLSVEKVEEALGRLGFREDLEIDEESEYLPAATAGVGYDPFLYTLTSAHQITNSRWRIYELASYRYRVEIHKKFAIAFACLIFVLLGPPLAMRIPNGGVGMVIATSVGIFFIYWMGLISGERLADRGQMDPVVAMWLPNVLLMIPAVVLMTQVAGRVSTSRQGGLWDAVASRLRAGVERLRALPGGRSLRHGEAEQA